MSFNFRSEATRRLHRDILELERTPLPSIAAKPLDGNIFEWHVNISPLEGVYSEIYFHLIMEFPDNYPMKPPTIRICTPIAHPNIFGSSLCLSMLHYSGLHSYTDNRPYEGWSCSYSITSILMQLQSFLFADNIEQGGGYMIKARRSAVDVSRSIKTCKSFKCSKCSHTHSTPYPEVIRPSFSRSSSRICAMIQPQCMSICDATNRCQPTGTQWATAYTSIPVNEYRRDNMRKVYYEATVTWTDSTHSKIPRSQRLARFGFGNKRTKYVGQDWNSFGYGGRCLGVYGFGNKFSSFGETLDNSDTIVCALDFNDKRIYFAKNGKILEPERRLDLDASLCEDDLYPVVSFRNTTIEFHFGPMSKPCQFLIDRNFVCLNKYEYGVDNEAAEKQEDEETSVSDDSKETDTCGDQEMNAKTEVSICNNEGIVDDIWLSVFESLAYHEIYRCKFVCKAWNRVINKFNVMDRNHIYCYFTKQHYRSKQTVLGIGLNISFSEHSAKPVIKSQMDYLSLNAWCNGVGDGVWGERLTHFLPLVINRAHSEHAHEAIMHHLRLIADIWPEGTTYCPMYVRQTANGTGYNQESAMRQQDALILVDIVITMMNQIVVNFVMDNKQNNNIKNVEMVFCDKVVLGYCHFHHLLLYLTRCFEREEGTNFITDHANNMVENFLSVNGTHKSQMPDLGKFLIYSMLSDRYEWRDFAQAFTYESFRRRVLWIVRRYPSLNNTWPHYRNERLQWSLNTSRISRRLVIFQCWFMLSNKDCTLQEYNFRLGRPSQRLRNNIQRKTKQILQSNTWEDYVKQLHLRVENDDFHQLLLFAVSESYKFGYHQCEFAYRDILEHIQPPRILYMEEARRPRVKPVKESGPNAWVKKAGVGVVGSKAADSYSDALPIGQARDNNTGGSDTNTEKRNQSQARRARRKRHRNKK